ncbi:MAG: hypothetical protein K2X66_13005, partial [Cyanobacteria bacterium]|nr:hypothetical protein [Cyanobacteriota bacterium]
ILNNPEEARAQLDDIINSFGLVSRYRQFQRQQGFNSGFNGYGSGFNSSFDNSFYAGGFSPFGSDGFDVRY